MKTIRLCTVIALLTTTANTDALHGADARYRIFSAAKATRMFSTKSSHDRSFAAWQKMQLQPAQRMLAHRQFEQSISLLHQAIKAGDSCTMKALLLVDPRLFFATNASSNQTGIDVWQEVKKPLKKENPEAYYATKALVTNVEVYHGAYQIEDLE